MSIRVADRAPTPGLRPPRSRWRWLRLTLTAILAVAAVLIVWAAIETWQDASWHQPSFPSLSAKPDPSLQGTVAYYAEQSRCVRVVAAAGRPSKTVVCLPPFDVAKSQALGKETPPQLAWRSDGRLEITVFRWTAGKDQPPAYTADYQKVVDVRTGTVSNVPSADVPAQPNLGAQPTVSPRGERLTLDSSGHVRLTLTDRTGASRRLLDVQAPSEANYTLQSAFWAPDYRWIAADDGRILVITPGQPTVVRVLTDETRFGAGAEPGFARFAVTSANLLAPAK